MSNIKVFGIALFLLLLGGVYVLNAPFAENVPAEEENTVVELKDGDSYELIAGFVEKEINGTKQRMLAYNGSIPGPTLKVPQGATITVRFTNNTDLPNTIHPHGVRLANAFDGVPDVTQKAVPPGETFMYTMTFPDAGAYWYHPHFRDDYAIDKGLYGAFLVTPLDSNYWGVVNREEILFVDDMLMDGAKVVPFDARKADRTLMGRFGNVMLVNGASDYSFRAKKGEVIRFFITNAANVRPFNFAIDGARMKLVGADGGAYERDTWQDAVLISPSERIVIEALFPNEGEYALVNRTPGKTYKLGTIIVSSEEASPSYVREFEILRTNQNVTESMEALRPYFSKEPDKRLKLTIDMKGGMGAHMMSGGSMMGGGMSMGSPVGGVEWEDTNPMMNAMSTADSLAWKIVDEDSGKENMNINWSFKKGEPVKIRIFNDPKSMHPMQHPIHFHGQRFLVTMRDGVSQTNLVWKDTVLVKVGETVDIVLDTSNPGVWMTHCHILEHIEAGMMFTFNVE